MKENKALTIGIVVTIMGFIAMAIIAYLGLRPATPQTSAMQAIPIEDVHEGNMVYEIIPEQSEARFTLNEVLRGVETAVVGSTNQVAGQLAAASNNLYEAQVGTILINARTLTTDNNFRNNTLRNDILFSHLYEFIIFEPTGLDEIEFDQIVEPEQWVTFAVYGNLTIRDITNPVTFSVSARRNSSGNVEGTAVTTIHRSDYQLEIPAVPGVADVDDTVKLEFDFVAAPIE